MKNTKKNLYTLLILILTINLNVNAQNKSSNQQIEEVETVEETEQPEAVRFAFIENPPIYPGCENLKGREAKDCMSKNVTAFVSKNFNTDLTSKIDATGLVRIMTQFTVDKNGEVTNIRARSKYRILQKEAKRVIRLLPKMQPGKVRNRPVKVTYTLPINFRIEDDSPSKTTSNNTPATFPGCQNVASADGKKQCTDTKLQNFVVKNFNKSSVKGLNLSGNVIVKTTFVVDIHGKVQHIKIDTPYGKLQIEIQRILRKLPTMTPAKIGERFISTKYLFPIILNFGQTAAKNDETEEEEIIIVESEEEEVVEESDHTIAFQFIQNPPVYPGCENKDRRASKSCMSKELQKFVGHNFNTNIATKLKLSGRIKILTRFTIDQNGNVTEIRARSKYPQLANEAKRVIRMIPKMKPGIQRGKPIKVVYTLPIIFQIAE